MILSKDDVALFYRLMWPLQFFVNRKLKLLPACQTLEAYQRLTSNQKFEVRNALYQHIGLIDEFVSENPQGLDEAELKIVSSWRKFVSGEFFIERYLAKHAIFIHDQTVYAVLALSDPFDHIVPRGYLPAYVKTVLLPFKGRIIYDGLIQGYSIMIGPGMASELKEIYLTAKQNHRIIESLEPQQTENRPRKPTRDWRARVDALRLQAQDLKAEAGAPLIQGSVFSLVKTSLDIAQLSVYAPDDLGQLREQARKVERALKRLYTILDRAE